MRQLTTLQDEAAANRLAAWLVTQKIEAHAEQEKEGWAVWVRDEDRLPAAKEHLAKFLEAPNDARYQGAEQQANKLLREEQQKRELAAKNVQDVSRQWGKGGVAGPKSCPLVVAMILASILVGVLTGVGESNHLLIGQIQFNGGAALGELNEQGHLMVPISPVWKDVLKGQVWRLVTPIFLHFGVMHLAFNMLWLYDFGGQIENRLKSLRFLGMVLIVAALSCIAQVVVSSIWKGTNMFPAVGSFGGMSGVNYGLFGFLYIRTKVFQDHYSLHPHTIVLMFIWLFLCMIWNQLPEDWFGKDAPQVANAAHVGGLLVGMGLAYLPIFKK
jgi:GlpG protein